MELKDVEFTLDYDGDEDFSVNVGGYDLVGQIWKPKETPRYAYIFIHGLGCFITFKRDFYPVITNHGGVVFACDHIGCGKSPGARTSVTVDEILDETLKIIDLVKAKYPGLPIVIHGHSMGGLSVIMLGLTKYDKLCDEVKCVISEAPWVSKCPQRNPGAIEHAGIRLLGWTFPKLLVPAGVELFTPDLDPRFVELVDNTPLYSHGLTARLFLNVEGCQKFAEENKEKWPPQLPMLYQQGTEDNLVDPVANDKWIKPLLNKEGLNVTYKSYEKGPHILLKSPLRPHVAKDILDYIDAHV
ncbi:Clan SC, family S33, methylesterase-like serine peptidase [Tritrichomonas foetus]|uniref:Clan SC, family S33, methylesterase-like serine peptidase n=1 Tax=Tritrichomonas foetus TaxID=1144522 RepID=A0A1J4KMI1_9EUKA|nr:Clan SC, family S33, methylesterase-like serine peptidase [Tritrichomonas foetus]|eukprot:OHT10581.1 Clan SC, family S33, methylesterase-like serine peptidase [Tritrichomonas foetus]